jgi:hypothetical protein
MRYMAIAVPVCLREGRFPPGCGPAESEPPDPDKPACRMQEGLP